jgi:rhamnosyltransferase
VTTPAASIIIPARNEATRIGDCLDAIFAQQTASPYEVIVIDSGSTDGTLDILARYAAAHPNLRTHTIRPEDFGHGKTRNLGARMAEAPVLIFLNADATPVDNNWLAGLLRELQPEHIAGVYGRQIARPDAYPMERFFLDYWYGPTRRVQSISRSRGASAPPQSSGDDTGSTRGASAPPQPSSDIAAPAGALTVDNIFFSTVNCSMKRDVWARFPFDETVVMTEDQVWSRQAIEAGYTLIYAPDCAVVHSHNYTLKAAFKRFFDAGWSAEASFVPDQRGARTALLRRTLAYPAKEAAWLIRTNQWPWLPRAALYEATKLTAVLAGRNHRLLPTALKRKLSANYRG